MNHSINQTVLWYPSPFQRDCIVCFSVWGAVKGAGRDGSLRFQWMDSDHKLKMLEALCMLPVRVQVL